MQVSGTRSQLEYTTEQKDLGIWIIPNMCSSSHCHKIANTSNQLLERIKHSFMHRSASSFTMFMLYKTLAMVRPHLEYCAPIWNPHFAEDIDVLEKVQRTATKLIPSITTLSYETIQKMFLYYSKVMSQGAIKRSFSSQELIPALVNTFSVFELSNNGITYWKK